MWKSRWFVPLVALCSFSVLNCIIYDGKLVNTCLFSTHIMLAIHLPMQLLLHSRNFPKMLLYRQK